jgi:ABC-type Zn uptake system ZnuABC Zn-binding protein ZnuA
VLGLAALTCLSLAAGCQKEDGRARVEVMTSTTMLEAIVREVGGDRVTVAAIVPANISPDEFELKPEHVERAMGADLFIMSGWEEWAPDIRGAGEGPGHVATTDIPGDLILPYLHLDAADSVTEALVRADPAGEVFYRYNRTDYRSRLGIEAEDVCASMFGLGGTRVICSDALADFLDWMGFDIVGTYGGEEDISYDESARLVDVGRKNAVRLVVDDRHSGRDLGKKMADDMGAARVVLTRYPDRGSYIDLLRANAEELVSALE